MDNVVLRKTVKKFDGLNPDSARAYDKYHISKTIGIALARIDFDDSLYNNGTKIKLFPKELKAKNLNRERLFVIMMILLKRKDTFITSIVM